MSRPERVFKAGAVRAAVFVNTIQRDGQTVPIRKVVIEVRYRDKNGEWKGSNSLSLNEIPKAITVLQQAYEYLLSGDFNLDEVEIVAPNDQLPSRAPQSREYRPVRTMQV